MEDFIKEHRQGIAKSIYSSYSPDSIEKAGQAKEGSRGGKVVGHTKSGKPIYQGKHESHDSFSSEDHDDASKVKLEIANKHGKIYAPGGGEWGGNSGTEKHVSHNKKYSKLMDDALQHDSKLRKQSSVTHKKLHEHLDNLTSNPEANWSHAGSLAQIHSDLAIAHDEVHGGKYTAHEGYSKTVPESLERHSKGAKELASKLDEKTLKEYWRHGNPDLQKSTSYIPDGTNSHRDVASKVFGSFINAHNIKRTI